MKEHKIGEIFEYNGEWYQCVEHKGCHSCFFALSHGIGIRCGFNGDPHCVYRSDGKPVIFKKLEKVGEPFVAYGKVRQKYKLYIPLTITEGIIERDISCDDVHGIVDIANKQNKEDMSNTETLWYGPDKKEDKSLKLSNLKPFSLEAAKVGKPVCTRDGRKVRIICFDLKDKDYPIVAAVRDNSMFGNEYAETLLRYTINGEIVKGNYKSDKDLMMLPEKKEGWVNVYKGIDGVMFSIYPYPSKDEAIKKSSILFDRIDTIKVSWEE